MTIPFSSFGIHIGGPIETNLGGQGISTLWPSWSPTSYRVLDVWGGVPPDYTYTQRVSDWAVVETTQGNFDWSLFDLVWAKLIAKGVTDVLFGFQNIPAWVFNADGTIQADAVSAWVTAFLTRARDTGLPIKAVEGPNEADVPANFPGTMANLITIQQAIYTPTKAFDPAILVLSPPYNSLQAAALYFGQFLDAGGGQYCDVIGFHGYPDVGITSPSTYQSYWTQFKAMLAAKGQGAKPIWNTEYNALNDTVDKRVTWIGWSSILDYANGVARRFVYAWDQTGYQLWNADVAPSGTINTAGIAYQQVMNWLLNATAQPAVLNGNVWTCLLQRNGNPAIAAWTDNGAAGSFVPPHWASAYKDLAGATTNMHGRSVPVGANVVLIISTNGF